MKLICHMSHIDWQGNPGTAICKGETFEIDDPDRIKTWVDAGYVSVVESEEGVDDTAPESISTDEVQEVKQKDNTKSDILEDDKTNVSSYTRKKRRNIKKS